MKRILFASTCMALMMGAAQAADALQYETPPAGFVWTGGYVGLQAGYAWGSSHLTVNPVGNFADPDPDGFLGGVYAGYNHQFANNVVLGVEADIAYADIEGSGPGFDSSGAVFPGVEVSGRAKWTGAVRARAGYAVDRFLPYLAGGVAFTKYKVVIDESGNIDSDSQSLTGWTVGAGVEYAFSDQLMGRFEYRYTDFGSKDFFEGIDTVDLKTHDLRIGIAYKF
ncbi:MAG: porin family protein [Mesorhizobium sp.]|nr:MAG: porin family protein [Mesorhizobium sp.]